MVNKAYRTISYDANLVTAGLVPIDLLIEKRINIKTDVRNGRPREISKRERRQETARMAR